LPEAAYVIPFGGICHLQLVAPWWFGIGAYFVLDILETVVN